MNFGKLVKIPKETFSAFCNHVKSERKWDQIVLGTNNGTIREKTMFKTAVRRALSNGIFVLFIHLLNVGKVRYTVPVHRIKIAFRIKTKC